MFENRKDMDIDGKKNLVYIFSYEYSELKLHASISVCKIGKKHNPSERSLRVRNKSYIFISITDSAKLASSRQKKNEIVSNRE